MNCEAAVQSFVKPVGPDDSVARPYQGAQLAYPNVRTVKAAVLADLLEGRSITHRDCWLEHGSARLSHHILMLRKAGWPIETHQKLVATSDGRTADIGVYLLDGRQLPVDQTDISEFVRRVRTTRDAMRPTES